MKTLFLNAIIFQALSLSLCAQGDFSLNKINAADAVILSADSERQQPSAPDFKTPGDAYVFPVKPGTQKWETFANSGEMLKTCQVPAQILRKMSTAALVETVLNYPLYWTTIISNSAGTQQGFNALASQFNGIQELLKRKDAGSELLLKYRSIPLPGKEATDMEIGDYVFYNYSIEILFAQGVIRAGLTEAQLEELKKEFLVKYEIRKELIGVGGLSKEIMALNGGIASPATTRESPTVVYTPKKSPVAATQMETTDEFLPREIRRCNYDYDSRPPDIGDSSSVGNTVL